MRAADWLREIERTHVQIELLKAELDACYASINLLPGVSFDGVNVQTSSNDSHVLALIEEATDKYNRLRDMIAEYEKQRAAAFAVVIGMDNRAYMRVLYLRYFSRLTWNEIAEAMGFKRDTKRAHQIHREAMAELDRVMGGEG